MKKLLSLSALLIALTFGGHAQAAGTAPANMTASGAIVGTQIVWCPIGLTSDLKCTFTQIDAFINAQFSGDFTCASGGACTLKNTGPGATGPIGNGTTIPVVTIDAQGRTTALTSVAVTPTPQGNLTGDVTSVGLATTLTNAPVIAKVLTGFTSGAGTVSAADSILSALQKINGNDALKAPLASPTFTGVPAAPTATVGTNTTQLATTAFVIANAGSGAVSSVTGGIGVTCSPTTGSVVCNTPATTTNNTGTTDTITSANKGTIVTESNAASIAVSITTAGFVNTDYFTVKNLKALAGVATYTPTSGTIDGAATLVCQPGQSADIIFGGTNYTTVANTCGLGTASTANTGTSGATVPLLNGNNTSSGNNTHSGSETFTEVIGGGRTAAGTTDTLAATDCGTTVVYSNAGAVTVTVPQGLPSFCTIALLQSGAGKVSTNGSAVTPATQHAAGSFTGTRAQWSVINITNYTTNTVVLSGDAS